MRLLYVNAIQREALGEALKAGLHASLQTSRHVQAGHELTLDSYDIFYGAQRYARFMWEWVRDRGYDAVILSGSEKSTTDHSDPWVQEYFEGLRKLLDLRTNWEHEWDGPPLPIVGICFGHQALARVLGGETARVGLVAGLKDTKALPQARSHPVFKDLSQTQAGQLCIPSLHSDQVIRLPRGFHATLSHDECAIAGMAHDKWPVFSFQGHPEMHEAGARATNSGKEIWSQMTSQDFERSDGFAVLAAFVDWLAGRKHKRG
ncbi:MAG: gamma-glutamyl-gamma-aminobutyrate hydrolase family protein [Bdellovibrionales bacterium]|nr:gamma-glutamyl-gamma-aminobutyrate hydrolase family protein [Bdellovibrionales bacterium]